MKKSFEIDFKEEFKEEPIQGDFNESQDQDPKQKVIESLKAIDRCLNKEFSNQKDFVCALGALSTAIVRLLNDLSDGC